MIGGLYIFAGMKICVGLSGGVDSSVAALLLKRQGYDVFAMFMQNWHDTEGTLHGDCEWEEDKFVAEMVARKIGIPFYFVDLSKQYRKRVVDYMFDEYSKGRTPNPDVLCNREIKFDAFLAAARTLGADMVATGHYCRKEEFTGPDGKTMYRILAGDDSNKDQSYFLCQLSQEQLACAMFPIGELDKPEVRRLAKEADLPSADKKDSQGICFVGKVDLPVFLQQQLKSVEGNVVEVYDKFYQDSPKYALDASLLAKGVNCTDDELPDRDVPRPQPPRKEDPLQGKPLGKDYRKARRRPVLHHRPAQRPEHRRPQGSGLCPGNGHHLQHHLCWRRPLPQGPAAQLPPHRS